MSAHALTEGIIAVWGSLIRRFPKKHTQKTDTKQNCRTERHSYASGLPAYSYDV